MINLLTCFIRVTNRLSRGKSNVDGPPSLDLGNPRHTDMSHRCAMPMGLSLTGQMSKHFVIFVEVDPIFYSPPWNLINSESSCSINVISLWRLQTIKARVTLIKIFNYFVCPVFDYSEEISQFLTVTKPINNRTTGWIYQCQAKKQPFKIVTKSLTNK